MRAIASPMTTSRRQPRRGPRATQPSTPPSNVRTTGPQGTLGGKPRAARKPGAASQPLKMGQEVYLWILVLVELFVIGAFRKYFRRVHGG